MLRSARMAAMTGRTTALSNMVEGPQWAGSSPYELALNRNFSGHNYTLREKRFEL
jgi:hypothetical protein